MFSVLYQNGKKKSMVCFKTVLSVVCPMTDFVSVVCPRTFFLHSSALFSHEQLKAYSFPFALSSFFCSAVRLVNVSISLPFCICIPNLSIVFVRPATG